MGSSKLCVPVSPNKGSRVFCFCFWEAGEQSFKLPIGSNYPCTVLLYVLVWRANCSRETETIHHHQAEDYKERLVDTKTRKFLYPAAVLYSPPLGGGG